MADDVPVLTVATAVYGEAPLAWATLVGLRAMHPRVRFDVLVVDNAPHRCPPTEGVCRAVGTGPMGLSRYVHRPDLAGTSAPRDACFHLARTPWVMVIDAHVFLVEGGLAAAVAYAEAHPDSRDVVAGPVLGDNGWVSATHWALHPGGLWGSWHVDRDPATGVPTRYAQPDGPYTAPAGAPFEVPAMGLGQFMMRRAAWPGFNPHFRLFGGEEGYLHEKVRRLGGRAVCLPPMAWYHRFRSRDVDPTTGRIAPTPYPSSDEDHVRNLVLAHRELGLDPGVVRRDFGKQVDDRVWDRIAAETAKLQPAGEVRVGRPRAKLLGVWYSHNKGPAELHRNSLQTVREARAQTRHDVRVATCSWEPVADNPFPWVAAAYRDGPGHLNIVRQIRQALALGTADGWEPDAVCFLEHDALYPPHYFDRVGDAVAANPAAPVVSHLDYVGLNATGWLPVKERHEPLYQLTVRYPTALANLDRAEADCLRQGWAYLEPDSETDGGTRVLGDRSRWVRLAPLSLDPLGLAPTVHVNHADRTTSHGEVVFHQAGHWGDHPHWGAAAAWWPYPREGGAPAAPPPACGACGQRTTVAADRPPPTGFQSAAAWLEAVLTAAPDFRPHAATLGELAGRCVVVAELAARERPGLAALVAAAGPATVLSVRRSTTPRRDWRHAAVLAAGRFKGRVGADLVGAHLGSVDLLSVDVEPRAQVVYDLLAKHHAGVGRYLVVHGVEKYGRDGDDGGPGVLAAVRRFVAEHPVWSVVTFDAAGEGMMVLSRDPADRPELPGRARQAWNFLKAQARHKFNGGKLLPLAMAEERLAECWVCPLRAADRCSKCSCYLFRVGPEAPVNAGGPGKAFYPHEHCPIGRWHARPGDGVDMSGEDVEAMLDSFPAVGE